MLHVDTATLWPSRDQVPENAVAARIASDRIGFRRATSVVGQTTSVISAHRGQGRFAQVRDRQESELVGATGFEPATSASRRRSLAPRQHHRIHRTRCAYERLGASDRSHKDAQSEHSQHRSGVVRTPAVVVTLQELPPISSGSTTRNGARVGCKAYTRALVAPVRPSRDSRPRDTPKTTERAGAVGTILARCMPPSQRGEVWWGALRAHTKGDASRR